MALSGANRCCVECEEEEPCFLKICFFFNLYTVRYGQVVRKTMTDREDSLLCAFSPVTFCKERAAVKDRQVCGARSVCLDDMSTGLVETYAAAKVAQVLKTRFCVSSPSPPPPSLLYLGPPLLPPIVLCASPFLIGGAHHFLCCT